MGDGFDTKALPSRPDVSAPDGTDVRILCALKGGSFAHFELGPGQTSIAVAHRTIEEIWYIVGGHGEMWRRQGDQETVVTLDPGPLPDDPARLFVSASRRARRAARHGGRHHAALAGTE